MSSTLINGKHPKIVIIDYYDDLIAQLDIYAETILEKITNDEYLNLEESNLNRTEFYYEPIEKQFECPYTDKYKFEETINCTTNILFKDFINSERMKAIKVIKELQKVRLDELKLAKSAPTTSKEALLGNKFGFLIKLDDSKDKWKGIDIKFKLITVVTDFYLNFEEIKCIEKGQITDDYMAKNFDQINYIRIKLLSKYLVDRFVNTQFSSESLVQVNLAQLYEILITVDLKRDELYDTNKVMNEINRSDLARIKSLELINLNPKEKAEIELNQKFDDLISLELKNISINYGLNEFKNFFKMRQMKFFWCNFGNTCPKNFLTYFPNLENLVISFTTYEPLHYPKNLKCLKLNGIKLEDSLEFLKNMPYLVVLSLISYENFRIEEETFMGQNELKVLKIQALKIHLSGKWFNSLNNLRELNLIVSNLKIEDFSEISGFFWKLEKLEISCFNTKVLKMKSFKQLKQLKSLSLHFNEIEKIEEDAFYGLDELTELVMRNASPYIRFDNEIKHHLSLEFCVFKGLGSLRKLCLKDFSFSMVSEYLFDNVPNLLHLEILNTHRGFEITERMFFKLRHLKILIFENNELERLENNVFVNFDNLVELSLHKNLIKRLNKNSFNGLNNLKILNLQRNYLSEIDLVEIKHFIQKMPKLKQVHLLRQRSELNKSMIKEKLKNVNITIF